MDWLLVILGVVTVLIFMAMFTLMRTMNSSYILRFESFLQSKLQKLDIFPGCSQISFTNNNRQWELLEVRFPSTQNQKTVYNDFLFLRVKTASSLSLRLVDIFTENKIRFILDDVFKLSKDKESLVLPNIHLDESFKEFKILTDDTMLAKKFLIDSTVIETLKLFKGKLGTMGFALPIVIQRGAITLDYSVSERYLSELVSNPRYMNKHIELLGQLANALEYQLNSNG